MSFRTKWGFRFSILLNLFLLFYIFSCMPSNDGGVDLFDKLQTSVRERYLKRFKRLEELEKEKIQENIESHEEAVEASSYWQVIESRFIRKNDTKSDSKSGKLGIIGDRLDTSVEEDANISAEVETDGEKDREQLLQQLIPCHDRDGQPFTAQRGDFWVLYNYVVAARRPHCWESITYTTHADYTFLDNLQPLLDRWRGPVSLALYAPGQDFQQTLNTIRYLRNCGSDLVKDFVTFHIYFPYKHIPEQIPRGEQILKFDETSCRLPAPWDDPNGDSYKKRKKLLYMVNMGRNIAREMASTHYVLASDIELYPSPELITNFLDMIIRQESSLLGQNPRVFVLPIFEVERNMYLPENKNELVAMLKNNSAITFHKNICPSCYIVPKSDEWIKAPLSREKPLKVFHVGKRRGNWEAIFIGTNRDPFYDERFSWEGRADKMSQGYIMCVQDYDFLILDSAFLVHKPGIKYFNPTDQVRVSFIDKIYSFINEVIFPELKVLFGTREGCSFM